MPDESVDTRKVIQDSVRRLATRLGGATGVRPGDIVVRVLGEGGEAHRLSVTASERSSAEVVVEDTADGAEPLIEILGDRATLQAVLDGAVDAREQFFTGGLRVRGDLRYLSDLALELGLLKHPL
jgi:hypothetical protein